MGDRGNICIVDDEPPLKQAESIYLYSQSSGWLLPACLQAGLRGLRPFEPAYNRPDAGQLAHRVYCEMLRVEGGLDQGQASGNRISTILLDNEYPVLAVHSKSATIEFRGVDDRPTGRTWTYDEFLDLELLPEPWSPIAPEHQRFHRRPEVQPDR